MDNKDTRYFNFPICLIDKIFENKINVLNNIFNYSIYQYLVGRFGGEATEETYIINAEEYFGVPIGDRAKAIKNGENLFFSIPEKSPKTGINKHIWVDFYKNEKTEFEIAVLCGFLAIRSILLFKPYCKITNNYMLVRMAGRTTVREIENLPEPLKKYLNRYHLDKIKNELKNNWNLKIDGKHKRGFYVSFDLELTDLFFEAEKKRKKYIDKNYRSIEAEARKQALIRLYGLPPEKPVTPVEVPVAEIQKFADKTINWIKKQKEGTLEGTFLIDGDIFTEKTDPDLYQRNTKIQQFINSVKFINNQKLLPDYILILDTNCTTITIKSITAPLQHLYKEQNEGTTHTF